MEKAKLSAIQLFALMFIFELGSALVVSLGISAKKDAWLAILLGMCGGIVLFLIYYLLYRQYPTLMLIGYTREIFGKYVGWVVGLLYVVLFLYIASRNVRDFGDLLLSSTMNETPLLAINILMILAICYVLYLGIEVLARTAEVLIVSLVFFGLIGNLFIYFSGNVNLQNLQPFLEHGWKPIIMTAFKLTIFFPFGELIAFTMLLPYLNQSKLVKKVWLTALIASGLILSYTLCLNIVVLGVEQVERATFPLLSTISKVNLLDFIQRLDVLVVFPFLTTMFFKISIFLYCAVIGIADLFKVKNYQQIIFPIGVILTILSMMIAPDFTEHIEEGFNIVPYYLYIPFFSSYL
ncbi:GerAB/ArcD/ProY family transporter [Metabacillus litoralis]|uniref:GerAB/ArcD/ProY family transporter n=1 Tax=Metabacillus litoralis TaxID=152268 RepID=UPI00203E250D|nr:GerAB/ArcD/ProY family transporter [Metabacillus litoralis]MCM3652339.1 spore germination protein [Metabacillus litoralis]